MRSLFFGRRARIDDRWRREIERMLAALNAAVQPEEMTMYRCHRLTGDKKGVWAMRVSPNWRLTFKWTEVGPVEINLEDYHGS